jgi:hypothetical protein
MSTFRRRAFRPVFTLLEERAVPANFYVDNAFAGQAAGTTVTFNAGQSNQVTGRVIGTDAFATIHEAIDKANLDATADSVFLANGTFNVDPTANASDNDVTNPLSIIGSGKTVTTILATGNSFALSGPDSAVINADGTTLNISALTFDGGNIDGTGKSINVGVRYESGAKGTISNTTFQNIRNDGANRGIAVLATDTNTTITVDSSSFANIFASTVRFDAGATGTVKSSTLVGRNTAGAVNYGVNVSNGSTGVLITGNTLSNYGKIGDGNTMTPSSAAVSVTDDSQSTPSTATIVGNSFIDNDTAIFVGSDTTNDKSTVNAQYNNFLPNGSFSFFVLSANTSNGLNNYYGNTNGPSQGTSFDGNVIVRDTNVTQPPNGVAQDPLPVVAATSPNDYLSQVAATASITGPAAGTSSPITLTVTFNKALSGFSGFTDSDVQLSGAVGNATVQSVTDLGGGKYNVVVGGLNKRGNLVVTIPAGSVTDNIGLGNQTITANVPFQPPFDVGFAASTDAGIVGPVVGVTDALSATNTRFNQSVFGSSFTGGTRVATADVTGDGTLDYVVASGPGRVAEVRVFDGATNAQLTAIIPFGASFTRGANVSAGDITGDGLADIVITAERGGGARVRVFRGQATAGTFTQQADFFGLIGSDGVADQKFRGGGRSGVGDINGDGRADLVFSAGTGGGPRLALFNGTSVGSTLVKLSGDFFVFNDTLREGAYVSVGDVNGDGMGDLNVTPGNGSSRTRVINGATILSSKGSNVSALADFFAFSSTDRTGARITAKDIDLDGKADLIVGRGAGAGSTIRVFNANALATSGSNPAVSTTLELFNGVTNGVFVG